MSKRGPVVQSSCPLVAVYPFSNFACVIGILLLLEANQRDKTRLARMCRNTTKAQQR